ncbi:hypothetical protein SDC9_92428 [bioreactor metagenome]|uniref:Uncharacterized protein n=1 Tax=bioreactor metagenome TaxID=1076179 RepID=A0A644ZYB1_9ZZZZ
MEQAFIKNDPTRADKRKMVKSKYISDILNLLLNGDNEGLLARNQLPFITEENFDYTGGGLFVRME